jgi:hypothetical protein
MSENSSVHEFVGISVCGKINDFGTITDVIYADDTTMVAVMSTGEKISMDSIAALFHSKGLSLHRDKDGKHIPLITNVDGSSLSKYFVRTKVRQRAEPIAVGSVSNTANVKGERINITHTVITPEGGNR